MFNATTTTTTTTPLDSLFNHTHDDIDSSCTDDECHPSFSMKGLIAYTLTMGFAVLWLICIPCSGRLLAALADSQDRRKRERAIEEQIRFREWKPAKGTKQKKASGDEDVDEEAGIRPQLPAEPEAKAAEADTTACTTSSSLKGIEKSRCLDQQAFVCQHSSNIIVDAPALDTKSVPSQSDNTADTKDETTLVHMEGDDHDDIEANSKDNNGYDHKQQDCDDDHEDDDNDQTNWECSFDAYSGCIICMQEFRPNQVICESSGSTCDHVFHQDCIVPWLLRNNACPVCRQPYIVLNNAR